MSAVFKTSRESFLYSVNSRLFSTFEPNSYLWLFDTKAPSVKTKPCGWSAKKREVLPAYTHQHIRRRSRQATRMCPDFEQRFGFLCVLWHLMWSRCESEAGSTGWRRASGGVSQHRNTRSEWDGETDGGREDGMSNGYRWLKHFQALD